MTERAHILIIDDDPIMRDMLHAVLSDDYEVSLAPGGREGIQIANEQTVDLVLLDVDMPSPDGYETCHFLKEDPATAEIPVICLSARTGIEERLKGYEAGGDDYLIKPYQPDELKAKISVLLVRNLLPESHPAHPNREEAERHGRARDNIALLSEGASSRIKAIDAETKALMNTVGRSIERTMAIFDEGDQIETRLAQVIAKLKAGQP